MKTKTDWKLWLQPFLTAMLIALAGAAFKLFLDVHDLNGKVEWLFHYTFPNMR